MVFISAIRTFLYRKYTSFFPWYCRKFYGMTIGEGTIISRRSNLDWNVNPKGIHIGSYTMIAGAVIHTHDFVDQLKLILSSETIVLSVEAPEFFRVYISVIIVLWVRAQW